MAQAFGPFELLRLLGRGGMGEVFVAVLRADPVGAPFVIKRLRPEVANDPEYRRRMLFEAQVATRLDHPNLARVLELGRVGDCDYLKIELVEGHSLRRLLIPALAVGAPPPLPAAASLVLGLAEGLAAMHGVTEGGKPRPILHRDVTPQNVIVARDGRPVLIDFGIAKDVFGPRITMYGRIVGTARYMAPEHRAGEHIDPRADVFALGVIAWELFAGARPWPSLPVRHEMLRFVFDPPEVDAALAARLPAPLLKVLLRALACRPEDRFDDAGAFLAALHGVCPEADAAAVRDWIAGLAIAEDADIEGLVVDHDAASAPPAGFEDLQWTASGRLARDPPPSRDSQIPGARVLTIPPLAPRRDAGLDTAELAAMEPPRTVPGWAMAVAGFLLVVGLGMLLEWL